MCCCLSKDFINIFWSGGWDSTFCVLQNLFCTTKIVQTYYVEPPFKASEKNELQAIEKIRNALKQKHPKKYDRLHFTYLKRPPLQKYKFYCADIAAIKKQHVGQRINIVPQLDLFIHYARTLPIDSPVYGIEKPPGLKPGCHDSIINFVDKDGNVSNDCPDRWKPLCVLKMPLFHTTKIEMLEMAKSCLFLDILNLSRFCPAPFDKPCGNCGSCKEVLDYPELHYRLQ